MAFLASDSEFESSDFTVADAADGGSRFEGWLQKKSPKGFMGKHLWQRRFFVLEAGTLSYSKEKSGAAIGVIRIDMIRSLEIPVESSHAGLRFDINCVGSKVFELMAPSSRSCTHWIKALRVEMLNRSTAVTEALRTLSDDQVADGYWKTAEAESVKAQHAHAEAALPRARVDHSRNGRADFVHDDEDEAKERAEALARMMEEEAAMAPATERTASVESTSNDADDDEQHRSESAAANHAQSFLQKQYSLSAIKTGGRRAVSNTEAGGSGGAAEEADPSTAEKIDALEKQAASDERRRKRKARTASRSATAAATTSDPSLPPARRPIASYKNADSDSDADPGLPAAAAAAQVAHSSDSSAPPSASSSPHLSAADAPALHAEAIALDSSSSLSPQMPFQSVLWKESQTGLFHPWQRRLFALKEGYLVEFRSLTGGDDLLNEASRTPLSSIQQVTLVEHSKKSEFIVQCADSRVLKLRGEDDDAAQRWVAMLQKPWRGKASPSASSHAATHSIAPLSLSQMQAESDADEAHSYSCFCFRFSC